MTGAPVEEYEPSDPGCANCGARLTGLFCAACGQKVQAGPPTVREFVHDAVDEVFSVDGKFFRSIYFLFTRPGFLTRELFNGRRNRYVRPLRLYLICSVAMFGMMALTSERITIDRPAPPSSPAPASAEERTAQFGVTSEMLTDEEQRQMDEQINNGIPRLMFLMVPGFALIVMLVMRGSGRTYPQHLYFALHVHAFVFGMSALLLPLNLWGRTAEAVSALSRIALSLIYGVAALKTAYGVSWLSATLRLAIIASAYLAWMLLAGLLVVLVFLGWWATRVQAGG
jgi:hypothetical protein